MFWNLYPAFDVDSLAFYFTYILEFLEKGHKFYSQAADIRHSVPIGENYLFALGFALQPNSTVFAQVIHGISKVMLMLCAYGSARILGAGSLSLLAPAFILSEEHVIASGANHFVRINMPLTFSIFLIGVSLYLFVTKKHSAFLFLALIAVLNAMTCKYLGVAYLAITLATLVFWIIYNKDVLSSLKENITKKQILILCFFIMAAAIPYLFNWVVTGSPVFPAALGPLTPKFYDTVATTLAKDHHYAFSLPDAIKNLTTFMVWPGILASKLLFPLALIAGFMGLLSKKEKRPLLQTALVFFFLSLIIVSISETYMIYEMRYYRYGIGIYSLAGTLLIAYILKTITDLRMLEKLRPTISFLFIILFCAYAVRYSFNVMNTSRPSFTKIINFLTLKESEEDIIQEHYADEQTDFEEYQKLKPTNMNTGFILPFSWPHTHFKIKGKNLAFLNSSLIASQDFFDKGLFAEALLKNHIEFIFNQKATNKNYPMEGASVFEVLEKCGQPLKENSNEFLTLNQSCLEDLSKQKNTTDAKKKLTKAAHKALSYPPYKPFNPPPYGGPAKLIH